MMMPSSFVLPILTSLLNGMAYILKKLMIQADKDNYLKQKFTSLVNVPGSYVSVTDSDKDRRSDDYAANGDTGCVNTPKLCNCSCTCVNKDIATELEGVKLDITIL